MIVLISGCARHAPPTTGTYEIGGSRIQGPITIAAAEYFSDGGSIQIKFLDATGRELRIVHHTPLLEANTKAELERNLHAIRYFYAGGFPSERGARRIEPGGADQRELERLLKDCIDAAVGAGNPLLQPESDWDRRMSPPGEGTDRTVLGFQKRLRAAIEAADAAQRTPAKGLAN